MWAEIQTVDQAVVEVTVKAQGVPQLLAKETLAVVDRRSEAVVTVVLQPAHIQPGHLPHHLV
jgi:hypothetical protein